MLDVHCDVLEACVRAGEADLDNSAVINEIARRHKLTPLIDRSPYARILDCRQLALARWSGLRLTILAVPPVISLIQADLQLSGTEIGILTGRRSSCLV